MIKIITAMGNQNFNNILKNEKEFEILENDIFYKEGILEFLEKNKEIDILILYEKLSGEINIINLIKKIKEINNQINIFFILENKNDELENLLKNEKIFNIFYKKENNIKMFFNNEINIKDFIFNLKNIKLNSEKNLEEEIEILKNIINKKDEELLKYKNEINDITLEKTNKKIVTIIGINNSGKSLILNNLKNIIIDKNKFEFKEININNFFEIKKLNNITYKFILILETNFEKIKLNKKIINKLIMENNINSEKINIIFNKIDKYSVNNKIIKSIFKEFKIIGKIKLNIYSDFLLNKENNYNFENIKLKRQYLKIIEKI